MIILHIYVMTNHINLIYKHRNERIKEQENALW